MSFNQRLALRIMIDLQKAKTAQMSVNELTASIAYNVKSLDSSFPKSIIESITEIAEKIREVDELTPDDSAFDQTISDLKKFVVTGAVSITV